MSIVCSLILASCWITAAARPRAAAPLKFEIKVVDSVSGKPKSKYFLGETVSVVFTLTNQGRRTLTIPALQDTSIPYQLVSRFENDDPKTHTGSRGGTGGAYSTPDGTTYWTSRAPDKMMLAPGQSVSVRIDDLRGDYSDKLNDGNHTLTATYMDKLKATVSFQVVIDERKTIPLLERMAAAPAPPNGGRDDRIWASVYLKEIRQPTLGGLVTDDAGKPLNEVDVSVVGPEFPNGATYETRSNGRYHLSQLTRGATYTLTPSLNRDGSFDANYTFDPPSRTVTNLHSKLTGLNFKATKVRPSTNIAEDREGATATASSMLSDPAETFEAGNVIDGVTSGLWDHCCNAAWTDATPNVYPDWVEINFNRPRAIDWINVFTLQDHPESAHDPTLNETFTKDGITDFDVQYWTGRLWKNVPGGAIRGNRNVWRKIAFPTITTNKIRVVVRKALAGYSKIMEIEAFHINEEPVVKLTGRSKGRIGTSFEFHTKASDRDWGIHEYTFDFGDGTLSYKLEYGYNPAVKELNLTHSHTYAAAGTYTVKVRVRDHDDEGSETAMPVTVTERPKPPFPPIGHVYHGVVGKEVLFGERASSDPIERGVSYRWYFDDGQTGTGLTTSHIYAAPGNYTLILAIVDEDGTTATYAALVVIAPSPITTS
ncbi:MAG TPA: PKD domain-containing protein, partial [Pyrinomonadaceae bacterium]